MAEKTLKTRIKLRYDEYANWVSADPILEAGEVAVTAVPTGTNVKQTTPPAILFKVGNGNGENSRWSKLPWASGLAADVYAWAKAETKPTYDYSELTGTPTIPTVGDGKITIMQGSTTKGTFTVNQANNQTIELTDNDTNTQYKLVLSDHTLKLQSRELTNGVWGNWGDVKDQSFTLPDTTYTFSTGSDDAEAESGTFTVTPKDGSAQRVKIKGLKSAAYTESSAYATAAQGATADKAMPKTGGTFTGDVFVKAPTADMNPATKQYVDSAIEGVSQFNYEVVKGELPTASEDTMGTIYLKAHVHDTDPEVEAGTSDTYDEYLTIRSGSSGSYTYSWEKIGNTDIDLSEYVNNVTTEGAVAGLIATIEKSGNKITATRVSLQAADPAASGSATDFIATVRQEPSGKIVATKKSVSTMTGASSAADGSKGLVPAPTLRDYKRVLCGDGTWVDQQVVVTKNETSKAYLLATLTTPTNTVTPTASIADTGVYLGTSAGQLVATEFKGKLTGNADTATKLKVSAEIDGVEFDGSESITHYCECDTGSNEVVKIVHFNWFHQVYGARITVKFNNNNLASDPQLSVNGTSPKPIYYRGQPIPASYLAANRTYEFIYNGTQYDLVGDINTDTDTHYTARLYVGASNAAKSNAAATNGNVYLNLVENSIVRDYHNIKGTGATTVTSDANGVITINSTDNNTAHSHSAGVGLVGSGNAGTSGTYTYKAKLKDETANTSASSRSAATTNRLYSVEVDKDGYLAVTVPWDIGTDTKNTAGVTDTSSKIYLIGAKSQEGDYQQTYSHDTAYVDIDGCLYSGGEKVLTSADLSNYVNTTDTQPIAGNKTFTGMTTFSNPVTCQAGVIAANGTNTLDNAGLSYNSITRYTNNTGYRLTIPLKNGTIATLEDITTTADGGLKISTTAESKLKIDIDDSVVFVLDGGNAAG